MMFCIEGEVLALVGPGIYLKPEEGRIPVLVGTLNDGRRLGLAVGDRVQIFGGPDGPGRFASSFGSKILPDGGRVKLPLNDRPRPGDATTGGYVEGGTTRLQAIRLPWSRSRGRRP